eukprot:m.6578 g.6578  ORF g.6578 m.6578 type:complete len:306 (+) comp3553_c0_seq1:274-1191(+)
MSSAHIANATPKKNKQNLVARALTHNSHPHLNFFPTSTNTMSGTTYQLCLLAILGLLASPVVIYAQHTNSTISITQHYISSDNCIGTVGGPLTMLNQTIKYDADDKPIESRTVSTCVGINDKIDYPHQCSSGSPSLLGVSDATYVYSGKNIRTDSTAKFSSGLVIHLTQIQTAISDNCYCVTQQHSSLGTTYSKICKEKDNFSPLGSCIDGFQKMSLGCDSTCTSCSSAQDVSDIISVSKSSSSYCLSLGAHPYKSSMNFTFITQPNPLSNCLKMVEEDEGSGAALTTSRVGVSLGIAFTLFYLF